MHIEKINISNPCPEDIELMDGSGTHPFCDKCEKRVHRISDLTREEAEALLEANQGKEVCINFRASRTGEIEFFKEGDPRPSPSQLAGVKKLLMAAVMVPLILTQPALLPAEIAVTAFVEGVEAGFRPTDVMVRVIDAEVAMLNRLQEKYGYKRIPAVFPSGANEVSEDDVVF